MVPDIEREWIAEEQNVPPIPPWLWIVVLLGIGWAIYRWLS